jgi:hypothetical protein
MEILGWSQCHFSRLIAGSKISTGKNKKAESPRYRDASQHMNAAGTENMATFLPEKV